MIAMVFYLIAIAVAFYAYREFKGLMYDEIGAMGGDGANHMGYAYGRRPQGNGGGGAYQAQNMREQEEREADRQWHDQPP